jgi:hypothetical protein
MSVASQIVCVINNAGMGSSLRPYVEPQFQPAAGEAVTTQVFETVWTNPASFQTSMRTIDEEFNERSRGLKPDPVSVVCSSMLNPEYVTVSNISHIASSGGFVLKVYAANNFGSRSRRAPEQKQLLGVCTVYIIADPATGQRYLYIATICTLNIPGTMKGVASRTINATKEIARHLGFAGVTLDSLMYCRNPMVEEVDTSLCLAWLHDYYLSQGFVLVNPHITDPDGTEVMEYEPVAGSPGRFNKKLKTNKKYKFSTTHTIPMIWRV